jgi:hypothetical protein
MIMKGFKNVKLAFGIATIASMLCLPASAQFKKGTLMLGSTIGSTAYSSANSDYEYDNGNAKSIATNTYTFGIGPQIGVFITPNVVLGGTLSFNLNNSDVNTTNNDTTSTSGTKTNTTTTTVSLGPFIRYYLSGFSGKNWLYAQINGAAGTGSGNNSGSGYNTTTTNTTGGKVSSIFNWNTGASLGMTHFFYKHIGMDFSIGYNYSHTHSYNVNNTNTTNDITSHVTTTTNNYTLDTGTNGITAAVGFHWFL